MKNLLGLLLIFSFPVFATVDFSIEDQIRQKTPMMDIAIGNAKLFQRNIQKVERKKMVFTDILDDLAVADEICQNEGFDCFREDVNKCVQHGSVRAPNELSESTRDKYKAEINSGFFSETIYPNLKNDFLEDYTIDPSDSTLLKHEDILYLCH